MNYKILISEKLDKVFKRIPKKDKARIVEKIDSLQKNPRQQDCKKLQGTKKPPLYRVRVGDYRIIYEIQDEILLVLVLDVGHRKDIYNN